MVEDYLSDREQEEALREWWRENWRWIVGGIVLGLGLLGGWRYWQTQQHRTAVAASTVYDELHKAVTASDLKLAEEKLGQLASEYKASEYLQQGRLLLAKARVDAGEFEAALTQLQNVAKDTDDDELARVARLRIARLQIQLGQHEEALKLLDPKDAGGFAAQVREVRGDALFAKGDMAGARAEYAAALTEANADVTVDRSLLELKVQQVGAPQTPTPEPAAPDAAPVVEKP